MSAAQSDPYLRFRQLLRGARPLGYVETLADRELAEGEWWSQPLFRDSRPSRWEGDGGAVMTAQDGRAPGLFPRWRPVLLKLDRLVENGMIDERFLVECWDRPGGTGHHADEHEQIGFVQPMAPTLVSQAPTDALLDGLCDVWIEWWCEVRQLSLFGLISR